MFRHFSSLDDEKKSEFLRQLKSIPVHNLDLFLQAARHEQTRIEQEDDDMKISPFRGPIGSIVDDGSEILGIEAIQKNQVACVLLAGGQGTRLGFDGPKGIFDLGLKSRKTLFQLIAERLVKLTQLVERRRVVSVEEKNATQMSPNHRISIPLYIMTSPMNHDTTRSFFESNNYFGLPSSNVIFFEQGVLPCLSIHDGKILSEEPGKCSMAPDGNGGKVLSIMLRRPLDLSAVIARGAHSSIVSLSIRYLPSHGTMWNFAGYGK